MHLSQAVSFWLLAGSTVTAKNGLIGYGINMFGPYCCTACSDALAMAFLDCTTFPEMDMGGHHKRHMDMMGETSDECYAGNKPYQETLAYCISSHCTGEGMSYTEQNQCFQTLNHAGTTGPTLRQSLPSTAPGTEMDSDAMWLNSTSLVNSDYYSSDRGTIQLFAEMEKDHAAWSIGILIVSVVIPLLTGFYLWLTSQLPTSRRIDGGLTNAFHSGIVLPAFFFRKHSQPLLWNLGYLPSRAMTLWIILYIVINILASSLGFRSFQPNSWGATPKGEMAAYIGNRAGVLSFANMALAILFATRNNPLLKVSGWDQNTQLAFHRWAARVSIVQAIVHSIAYTMKFASYTEGGNMMPAEAAKAYWWWGIIATVAMSLMAGLSALPLRKLSYEVFLVSHIVLAILSLLGSWYHIAVHFQKNWGYEVWLYLAFAFWAYDRIVRFGKTLFNTLTRKPVAHFEAIPGTNATMMTIALKKSVNAGPGQHIYVHFLSSGKFWEAHPFTICGWDDRSVPQRVSDAEQFTGSDSSTKSIEKKAVQSTATEADDDVFYLRCLFRAHKGMTSVIRNKVSNGSITLPIAFEGTYGGTKISHLPLKNADIVVCIAGGVGITFASSFVQQYARERMTQSTHKIMSRCKKFTLAWSVRESELFEHCRTYLLPKVEQVDDGSLDYQFFVTGQKEHKGKSTEAALTHGRMNARKLFESMVPYGQRVAILCCGPPSLADDIRFEVARCSREGLVVDLIEESFSF